jgi:60 kDa SS-A/Ro ribonucleoprotein
MTYGQHFGNTPQREPLHDKPQIKNAAGGYVFQIDDWQRLHRFLILGCEGGTYYETERKLTLENASCIKRCLHADGRRTVDMIVMVSDRGLAPKNDAAVFALAVATKFGNEATRKYAFSMLDKVCRIGTHLFQFVEFRQAIGGGWGRGVRQAVANWYNRSDLILQALKFQQRNGWSHANLLRLAHPTVTDPVQRAVFSAILHPQGGPERAPGTKGAEPAVRGTSAGWAGVTDPLVEGYLKVQAAITSKEAAALITQFRLPREFIPTQFLTEAPVWAALLPHMPIHALTRNLGNLSKCGLLAPLSDATKLVTERFADGEALH